jgi:hypothetical protein
MRMGVKGRRETGIGVAVTVMGIGVGERDRAMG